VGTFFFILSLFPDEEEQLTPLEQEVIRAVYRNASTGCTARMIYEEFGQELEWDVVQATLKGLKQKGRVLKVPGTLWLVSGN
jgi:hypothetical protein